MKPDWTKVLLSIGPLSSLLAPSIAWACTCAFPTYADKLEVATAVFRGYVTAASLEADEVHFVVQVDEALMGNAEGDARLRTKQDGAGCGMGPIAVGAEYLFVIRSGNSVSSCSGSQRLLPSDRQAVLNEIRAAIAEHMDRQ